MFLLLGTRSIVDKLIAAEMKKMPKPRDPASLFPDIELFKVPPAYSPAKRNYKGFKMHEENLFFFHRNQKPEKLNKANPCPIYFFFLRTMN